MRTKRYACVSRELLMGVGGGGGICTADEGVLIILVEVAE
jgi:hypothetical protein